MREEFAKFLLGKVFDDQRNRIFSGIEDMKGAQSLRAQTLLDQRSHANKKVVVRTVKLIRDLLFFFSFAVWLALQKTLNFYYRLNRIQGFNMSRL